MKERIQFSILEAKLKNTDVKERFIKEIGENVLKQLTIETSIQKYFGTTFWVDFVLIPHWDKIEYLFKTLLLKAPEHKELIEKIMVEITGKFETKKIVVND